MTRESMTPASPEPLHPAAREMPPPATLASYPPVERWDDWEEYDPVAWPEKVKRHYSLIPTICFNCEAGCGLLAYVDKKTLRSRSSRATRCIRAAAGATAPRARPR